MPVFSEKPPVLPPPNTPVVGPDGKMTPAWYEFFSRLLRFLAL